MASVNVQPAALRMVVCRKRSLGLLRCTGFSRYAVTPDSASSRQLLEDLIAAVQCATKALQVYCSPPPPPFPRARPPHPGTTQDSYNVHAHTDVKLAYNAQYSAKNTVH